MKRIQQQHLQATQSPLMCALAIIIHIPSHPIAEGQCLCAGFHCPNWYAVVRFPVPHTEGQMGTLSLKRCCCNFGQTPYATKRNTLKVLRMGTTFFLLSNPQKLAPLIVTFASTNTPATFIPNQSEREKKDVCNIYVYIQVYIYI